jgi:hypothetical protein
MTAWPRNSRLACATKAPVCLDACSILAGPEPVGPLLNEPAVVPPPADWRDGLEVVGYWWPARPTGWSPPADLENFLNAGPPPVFIGFGSMTPAGADRLSDLAAAAGRQAGLGVASRTAVALRRGLGLGLGP